VTRLALRTSFVASATALTVSGTNCALQIREIRGFNGNFHSLSLVVYGPVIDENSLIDWDSHRFELEHNCETRQKQQSFKPSVSDVCLYGFFLRDHTIFDH
jgi:hypothetical protein